MRIVPNGNRRLVMSQTSPSPVKPPSRTGIEQEPIGGQPNAGADFNPMANLDNKLQQQQQSVAAPDQAALNNAVAEDPSMNSPGGNVDSNNQGSANEGQHVEGDFREAYYKLMESLGVPPRLFRHTQYGDKFFHISEEIIGNGEANGFFVLPSKTQNKAISEVEAKSMAKKLGSQFGVTNMSFSHIGGNNYKFTFSVLVQDDSDLSNTSLDSMIAAKGSGKKAAYSTNMFIKESNVIDSLIKQGFGGRQ